jgi:hypothetical protein
MQHQQPSADGRGDAGPELTAPPGLGSEHPAASSGGQLSGAVGGAAIGDDDFVRNGKKSEVLQEPGQARRLVEGRNEDRKERNQLRTRT